MKVKGQPQVQEVVQTASYMNSWKQDKLPLIVFMQETNCKGLKTSCVSLTLVTNQHVPWKCNFIPCFARRTTPSPSRNHETKCGYLDVRSSRS